VVNAILVVPLGLIIGLALGALGGGGSVLAVPVLVHAGGLSTTAATGASLVVVGAAAAVGAVAHHRAGHVRAGTGVAFALAGAPGAFAGTWINRRLDGDVLLLAFSVLVLGVAWQMASVASGDHDEEPVLSGARAQERPARGGSVSPTVAATRRWDVGVVLTGCAVGVLTGVFGVGGGFVVVPALVLLLAFDPADAVGTSLLVVTLNSAVALAIRHDVGALELAVVGPFAVAALVGVLGGRRVSARLDRDRTARAFAVLLVVVAVLTAAVATGSIL
jgi:uncharacterized protein